MPRFLACSLSALLLVSQNSAAETTRAPHPEPRVIVTVTALKGPHDRARVQHAARTTWGRIVRCYKELGQRERGKLSLRLEISARGKVIGARKLQSTLNEELDACLVKTLGSKDMPPASSGSTASIEIQLAPGDE